MGGSSAPAAPPEGARRKHVKKCCIGLILLGIAVVSYIFIDSSSFGGNDFTSWKDDVTVTMMNDATEKELRGRRYYDSSDNHIYRGTNISNTQHVNNYGPTSNNNNRSTTPAANIPSTCPPAIRKAVGIYNTTNPQKNGFQNVLLLLTANYGYLDFLLNWEYLAKKHGLKYGIIAMDIPLYQYLKCDEPDSKSLCMLSDKLMTSGDHTFATKGFADISCHKLALVMDIIDKCNVDVVFSDVDNIFVKDPFQHDLGRLIKMGSYDYVYSTNWRAGAPRNDTCLKDWTKLNDYEGNTGFYYLSRKSKRMAKIMNNTLRVCAEPTNRRDDQKLFWSELHRQRKEQLVRRDGSISWYHCSINDGYDSPPKEALANWNNSSSDIANLCCLDPYYHQVGIEQSRWGEPLPRNEEDIITYHGNWARGKDKKIERMKEIPSGWNIQHLQTMGVYDSNNNRQSMKNTQKAENIVLPSWNHIYTKSKEGRSYFTFCNLKRVYVDKMPHLLGGQYGFPGWTRHPHKAMTLGDIPSHQGYDSDITWNEIRAFLHMFDVAFDQDLSIVIRESQLRHLFFWELDPEQQPNNNIEANVWKQRIEDILGITIHLDDDESNNRSFGTYLPYNASQLYNYESKRGSLDQRIWHQHHVLQNMYQFVAQQMMPHSSESDASRGMCCDLQTMFGKGGGDISEEDVPQQYMVLHAGLNHELLQPEQIASFITASEINASSILMITDDCDDMSNEKLAEKMLSHPVMGPSFQVLPKDRPCSNPNRQRESRLSEMMLAIGSDLFIGNVTSSFARYAAQVRYALGVGPSYLYRDAMYKSETDDVSESEASLLCDETCLYEYQYKAT